MARLRVLFDLYSVNNQRWNSRKIWCEKWIPNYSIIPKYLQVEISRWRSLHLWLRSMSLHPDWFPPTDHKASVPCVFQRSLEDKKRVALQIHSLIPKTVLSALLARLLFEDCVKLYSACYFRRTEHAWFGRNFSLFVIKESIYTFMVSFHQRILYSITDLSGWICFNLVI